MVRQGGLTVRTQAFFHVAHYMFDDMYLLLRDGEHLFGRFIALHQLRGGETGRTVTDRRLIFDDMRDGMDRLMDFTGTKIQVFRNFLLFCRFDQLIYQVADSFIFARGNRYNRNSQEFTELFYVDCIAAGPHFIHHVEGDDHGFAQLHQLERQVQVSLNVSGIHDIENAIPDFP